MLFFIPMEAVVNEEAKHVTSANLTKNLTHISL